MNQKESVKSGKIFLFLIAAALVLNIFTFSYYLEDYAEQIRKTFEAGVTQTPKPTPILDPSLEQPDREAARVVRVIDGDTIELDGGVKVRYIGIDTPETYGQEECFGKEASERNRELVFGKVVYLEKDVSETDRYGRLLRYVYYDNTMVNETLVKEGYAFASSYPPDIKYQDRFVEAEKFARDEEMGLWGAICP